MPRRSRVSRLDADEQRIRDELAAVQELQAFDPEAAADTSLTVRPLKPGSSRARIFEAPRKREQRHDDAVACAVDSWSRLPWINLSRASMRLAAPQQDRAVIRQ